MALSILTVLGLGVSGMVIGDHHKLNASLDEATQKQLRLVHDGLHNELLRVDRGLDEMGPVLSAQVQEPLSATLEKDTGLLLNLLPAVENIITVDLNGTIKSRANRSMQAGSAIQPFNKAMLSTENWPAEFDVLTVNLKPMGNVVALRHVLNGTNGERVGLVIATLDLEHFQRHLSSLHVNDDTSSAIVLKNGEILALNSRSKVAANNLSEIGDIKTGPPQKLRSGPLQDHYAARSAIQPSSIHGIHWPLEVVVWIDTAAARAATVRDTSVLVVGFAMFCALALWGIRQSNRQRLEQARLQEEALALQTYEQERFLLATESADIGVWQYSMADQNFIWDSTMRRIYGAESRPEEIPYAEWLGNIVEEDRSRVENIMLQAVASQGAFEYGFAIRRASDGVIRNIHARAKLHRDAKGHQIRIIGVNMDISHQRRAEQALKEAEERFRSSFESAAIGMAILSPQGHFLQVNDALCKIVGYQRAELLSTDFLAITHPEDHTLHVPIAQEISKRLRDSYQLEKRYIHKSGHVVWVFLSVSAVRMESGKVTHLIVQVQDINERKRQEAKLIEREHFLRTLSECLPGLVSYWSTDLRCHFANKNHEKWSGLSSEKMRGLHIRRVLGEDNYHLHYSHIEGVLKGQKQRFEKRKALPTGGYADMLVHLIPDVLYGKVEGFFSISTNITDFKAQQRELERMNQQLVERTQQAEAASKAKGAFLANMSHEIRTPMNAIMGILQLIGDTPLNPNQQDYFNKIGSAADVLLNVLNDILDLSRVEANQLELTVARFELDQLLSKCMDLFSYRAKEKDIQIFCTKEADCPTSLEGDRLRLAQILNNLLSNAVKFTDKGHIHLNVKMSGDKENLIFTIKDTGIGMNRDQCKELFKPFSQVDESPSRRYGGAGLGLSICKQLAELMKGEIWVESELNQGTTFSFTVPCLMPQFRVDSTPLLSNKPSATAGAVPVDEGILKNKRVLVVDDHKLNRMVASEMLKKWGAQVELANNGVEAVKACETQQFDWILMDVQMPEMDGFEATRRIRGMLGANAPHIIAVTASASEKDRADVLNAGMSEHVVKPFKKEELLQIMMLVGTNPVS